MSRTSKQKPGAEQPAAPGTSLYKEVEMQERDTTLECLIYELEYKPAYRQLQLLLVLWIILMSRILRRAWIIAGGIISVLIVTAALINIPEVSLILGVSAGIIFGGLLVITLISDILKS